MAILKEDMFGRHIDMNKLINKLEKEEGVKLKKYTDSRGFATIGTGRNIQTNPLPADIKEHLRKTGGITKEMNNRLLAEDMQKADRVLRKAIPKFDDLPDSSKHALMQLAHVHGPTGTLEFKKLLGSVNKGDLVGASKHLMKSDFAKQAPNRANRMRVDLAGPQLFDDNMYKITGNLVAKPRRNVLYPNVVNKLHIGF